MNDTPLAARVREMILSGALAPGERVTEAGLAARLGVSRTPIRNLLAGLAAQGLLIPVGRRGLAVSAFNDQESWEALQLRSVLEGQAARLLAKRGVSKELLAALNATLERGDKLFDKRHLDRNDEEAYGQMNDEFHRLIVDSCGSALLRSFVERLNAVPFVAPSVIVFEQVGLRRAFDLLFRAHGGHHAIVEALKEQNAERAETLFREHAYQQRESMLARRARQRLPGAADVPTATPKRRNRRREPSG